MRMDVIIPAHRPGERFLELLRRLQAQTQPVGRFIIMNTGKAYWDEWVRGLSGAGGAGNVLPENLSVFHVTEEEFDHGATRHAGIERSDADVCVLMTDDALPGDRYLLERLAVALASGEKIAVAYARQLPQKDCGVLERYTREFNYPPESRVKTKADLPEMGIKTYFCSNVCAAYKRDIYMSLGGFIRRTIFNEDMIYAAKAVQNGYAVCYAADAEVIHSHNYTNAQQFHRNFDMAVSQADHPEVFSGIPPEGEGIRLVKRTASMLLRDKKPWLLPHLVINSGCKYLGYRAGRMYKKLPGRLVLWCSMNRNYWRN